MVAAVCICGAAVAFSAESPDPAAGPAGGDPGAKSSRGPSGEASQRDPLLQEAKRASQQAEDAAEKHRASAEGKQERAVSKTAFRGMSSEDARALYWKKFPKLAEKAAWRPLAAFAGDEIDVLSPFSAVVKTDRKRPGQLVTSVGVPLGVQEDGRYKPADARLTSTEDAFRPRASVVGTRIGQRLSTGVTVDQVSMTLVDAEDATGVEIDDKVFYANVEQDTDLVVVTTPTGIETFAQLRTPESPEREKFAIGMPQGATLLATKDGGAEIVADRQKLAKVHPPQAVDAQGRSVPVEMAVVGEHLIVTTHHRDGDFAYPVVSDPALTDYWDYGSDKWDGAGEWNTYSHSATAMSFPSWGSFGAGRYIHAPPGIYYNGNWGEWSLPAYGQSFFSRAVFYDNILHYNSPAHGRDQHWFDLNNGIWSRQQGRWTAVRNWGGETLWGEDVDVVPNAAETVNPDYRTGDLLVMQLLSHADFGRDYWTEAFVGGVVAVQEDHNVPVITRYSSGPETNKWMTGGTTSLNASAQDVGLGVKYMGVYRPGGQDVQWHGCSGHQRSRCPHNLDTQWSWNVDSWPEGVNRLGVHSTDIIGRQSAQRQWDVKIDRTAPEVAVAGQLLDETLNMTGQDLYSVRIEARDGDANGPAGSRRSGVAHARVLVDGIEQQRRETASTCVDSCTLTDEYELDTDDFAEGNHTVRIEVQDRAGNPPFTKQWTISIPGERRYTQAIANWRADVEQRVDRALPAVGLTSPMPAPPDWWRRESECLASEDALRRCFEDNWSWGQSVEQWLEDNGGPAVAGDELPAYPIFVYAPSPELPVDLTQGTAGAWEVARRAATSTDVAAASTGVSATSTAVSVGVDLSFREPLTLVQTTALLTTLGVPAVNNLRGVFDAAGAGITGENEYARPEIAATTGQTASPLRDVQLPSFFQAHRSNAAEVTADISNALADDQPEDVEETADLEQARSDAQAMERHLAAGGAFVTAIRGEMSLAGLRLLLKTERPSIKAFQVVESQELGQADFKPIPTDAEILSFRAPPGQVAAMATDEGKVAATATSARRRGRTCADLRETGRQYGDPRIFMPNRWDMKVSLYGDANDAGLHVKRNRLYFRWSAARSLAWFCSDRAGDRGFEPETKPKEGLSRWSNNWDGNSEFFTTLPRAYKDDLSCGPGCVPESGVYAPPLYPDFAIGTAYGRYLRYGNLYYSVFRTNRGEANEGTAVIRGQQITRAHRPLHGFYCRTRSATSKGNNDRYCMFKRSTHCVRHIPLRTAEPVRRRMDWSNPPTCAVEPNP